MKGSIVTIAIALAAAAGPALAQEGTSESSSPPTRSANRK